MNKYSLYLLSSLMAFGPAYTTQASENNNSYPHPAAANTEMLALATLGAVASFYGIPIAMRTGLTIASILTPPGLEWATYLLTLAAGAAVAGYHGCKALIKAEDAVTKGKYESGIYLMPAAFLTVAASCFFSLAISSVLLSSLSH